MSTFWKAKYVIMNDMVGYGTLTIDDGEWTGGDSVFAAKGRVLKSLPSEDPNIWLIGGKLVIERLDDSYEIFIPEGAYNFEGQYDKKNDVIDFHLKDMPVV